MSDRKILLHLVPGYGTTQNAIYDYALVISEYLKSELVDTEFRYNRMPDLYVMSYVNAGYSFLEHISNIIRLIKFQKRKLKGLVFFHEAYAAQGKLYQKSFWYYPIERLIFKMYVRNASAIFCSCEPVLKHIQAYHHHGVYLGLAPVPSNIVFKNLVPWMKRKEILVVFGTYGRRAAALKRKTELKALLTKLSINVVIDIGAGDVDYSWLPLDIAVKKIGYLKSTYDVAEYIASAKYGLIDYPGHLLDKSGIFATYAAAGLCVINTDESIIIEPNLYFRLSAIPALSDVKVEDTVLQLHAHYQNERSVKAHTEKLLTVLKR